MSDMVKQYGVTEKCISIKYKEWKANGYCFKPRKAPPPTVLTDEFLSKLKEVVMEHRQDTVVEYALKMCAAGYQCSAASVQNGLKRLGTRLRKPKYRPALTQSNKNKRKICAEKVVELAAGKGGPEAVDLVYNHGNSHTVFIDYKWFYVRNQRKVRYFPGEPALPPECYDKSFERKGYGEKVMYMCAVTNPCPEFPDGKIGLFPCVKRVLTKKKSRVRDAGIWHNVDVSITGKLAICGRQNAKGAQVQM